MVATEPTESELEEFYRKGYSDDRAEQRDDAYDAVMRRRATVQVQEIGQFVKLERASVLDYGCGYGALLDALASAGAKTTGVDYDAKCLEAIEDRHSVLHVTDPDAWDQEFDLICMSHVLEHLRGPRERLESIRRHAKWLFIEVPAYDHRMATQFSDTEGHLWFFTQPALEHLLRAAGWHINMVHRAGPGMDLFWRPSFPWPVARRIARKLTGDWFFNCYGASVANGIWLRALANGRA